MKTVSGKTAKKKTAALTLVFLFFVSLQPAFADEIISGLDRTKEKICDGTAGQTGENGGNGEQGRSARPLEIVLRDIGDEIIISGKNGATPLATKIKSSGEYIHLQAMGGNGGNGGAGGAGAPGKDGANGLPGQNGSDGRHGRDGNDGNRSAPDGQDGENGENGEDGEDGGNGQDGGAGGNAGNGGNGGNGGDGAAIVVKYDSADVLMHVMAKYNGGSGGSGGKGGRGGAGGADGWGGRGGNGGSGGAGGNGGKGYSCSAEEKEAGCRDGINGSSGHRGLDGSNGNTGRNGTSGNRGKDGVDGHPGERGRDGSITFVQLDAEGKPLPGSETDGIYDLKLESFQALDQNRDGIFKPGETVDISDILIKNIGKLNMPGGAVIVFSCPGFSTEATIAVPRIPKGEERLLPASVSLGIPKTAASHHRFTIHSTIRFRGLPFAGDPMNASIVTEYPVIIERIDCDRFVSGAGERKMAVQLKNISQKSYDSLQLVYTDQGILQFNVLEKISAIAPGSVRSETLTVSVPGNVTTYKEEALNVSLIHGNERFDSRDVPLVAVPAFAHRTDSDGLLIFHGPLREPALIVMAAIESLGMDFDIYDLNANAAPQAEIFAGYRGKVIGLVNFGGEVPALHEHLNDFAQKKGGILTIDANPEIRPVYHPDNCLNRNESFFALSPAEQKKKTRTGVLSVLPFERKLAYLEKHFFENDLSNAKEARLAVARQIQGELKLVVQRGGGHEAEITSIKKLHDCILALNPVTRFTYRAFLLETVDELQNLKKAFGMYPIWKKFRKFYQPLSDLRAEMKAMPRQCSQIKGTYIDENGNGIMFWRRFPGKLRGLSNDRSIRFFNGRKSGKNKWIFAYTFMGNSYQSEFTLTFDGEKIVLTAASPHNNSRWHLLKVNRRKLW